MDIDTSTDCWAPNYSTQVSLQHRLQDDWIPRILHLLELDNSAESREIAEELMRKGRQILVDYENNIGPDIFQKHMDDGSSELSGLLKSYWEQEWQSINEEWFRAFLHEQKTTSTVLYDQILTRNAQWGSRFVKDNILLSLVIQFLFEFNDEVVENDTYFNDRWETLTTEGRQGLNHYSDDLSQNVLVEQLENNNSPLYLALQNYFQQQLIDLFKQKDVNITRSNVIETVLDRIVDCGWRHGFEDEAVRKAIAPNKLTIIKQKLNLPCIDHPRGITTDDSLDSSISSDSVLSSSQSNIGNPLNENEYRQRQRRNQEIGIISTCIKQNNKFRPAYLVEAGELIYTNKTFNKILDAIITILATKKNFPSFIHECLTPIIYLLKRHQTLDDFIENLSLRYRDFQSSMKFPELSLRMLIHILLLNSNLPSSRMIISLLCKRNPVPFLEPSISNGSLRSYPFVPDIIHVWDYSKPVILSFGIGKCSGKSTLLNKLFMCSFEQSVSSIYFQETIDIDFGYNLTPTRTMNFADTHGIMSKDLLRKIHHLFDAFIIQVEYRYLDENRPAILSMLDIISKADNKFLIVRDVPAVVEPRFSETLASRFLFNPSIESLTLPNVADRPSRENQQFQEKIFQHLPKIKCSKSPEELRRQLQKLMNTKYQQHTDQIYQTIFRLKSQLIHAAEDNSYAVQCFPEYAQFVELCRLQAQLMHYNFYETGNDMTVYNIRQDIYKLQSAPRNAPSKDHSIFDLFLKIFAAPNMLICLELLGNELKQERTRLVHRSSLTGQLPIEKSLNLEVLWRNAIVCSFHQSYEQEKRLFEKYYEYIMAGFPFEIIDGDNFYYQQPFLSRTLKPFPGKKILVISVIGPQNSGKSTLLNYMFGTFFDVRDGRCTRGVYGSFVKSNRPDFDYILLIDTEGLLSIERKDPEYDRRIVLFCLAVSHVVIVNIHGELTSTIQTLLTLCADSLKNMDVPRIPKPVVHIILTQKIDLDMNNDQTAIDCILANCQRFQLNQSIDIQRETFHRLPSAFQIKSQTFSSNENSLKLIKTDLHFLEHVQSICEKILCSTETSIFSSPCQWLKVSKTVFDTLQKFADLTYYQDINDRRTDQTVREQIENWLRNVFTLDNRERWMTESLHKTEEEIKQFFISESTKWQSRAVEDAQEIFRASEASESIQTRRRQFLETQIKEMFNALQATSIAINEREKVKLLVRNGAGDLQMLIDTIIHRGTQMSIENARDEFDRMLNNCLIHIKSKFVSEERLKQALNYIYANYNIYEKECLPAYQFLVPHLSILNKMNEQNLSIGDFKEKLILQWTNQAYQSCLVTAQYWKPNEINRYSIEMIDTLSYLNKTLLKEEFLKCNHQEQFQMNIRTKIQEQMPRILTASRIDDENMFLRITVIIKTIIEQILTEMQHDRQIHTEFVQKLVEMITHYIADVNQELAPFCLTLSRPLKSILHLSTVLLLTKSFYDEQSKHFKDALADLSKNKKHLRNYFINMVASNASTNTNYAIHFLRQLLEHLHEELKSHGQHTIDEQFERHEHINRKSMQDLCDDRLTSHDDVQWNMDYIEHPTKMIEQVFIRETWKDIEHSINQHLAHLKSNYRNILIEFFPSLPGMNFLFTEKDENVLFR